MARKTYTRHEPGGNHKENCVIGSEMKNFNFKWSVAVIWQPLNVTKFVFCLKISYKRQMMEVAELYCIT